MVLADDNFATIVAVSIASFYFICSQLCLDNHCDLKFDHYSELFTGSCRRQGYI